MPLYMSSFWVYVSYTELAWGFVLTAVLLLLLSLGEQLLESIPIAHHALTRPVILPENISKVVPLLSLIPGALFILLSERVYYPIPVVKDALWHAFLIGLPPLHDPDVIALPFLIVATLGFMLHRLDRGFVSAFKWSLKVFVLPGLLLLTVGLWLNESPEMVIYVTKLTQWSFGNIDISRGWNGLYLLSNWTVLVVAASLFTAFVLEDSRSQSGRLPGEPVAVHRAQVRH